MNRCKSKGPANDMPIDMVEAVLNRLFTVEHRPSRYEGYEETTEDEGGSNSIVIDKADVVDIAGRINTEGRGSRQCPRRDREADSEPEERARDQRIKHHRLRTDP